MELGALPQTPLHFFSMMKRNEAKKNLAGIKLYSFSMQQAIFVQRNSGAF